MADSENPEPEPAQVEAADVSTLCQYLRKIIPVLLEEGGIVASSTLENALEQGNFVTSMNKFLSDSSTKSLIVAKCFSKDNDDDIDASPVVTDGEATVEYTYNIYTDIAYTTGKQTSVLFLKKTPIVEAEKPIASQLRVHHLQDGSPYESLHAYVSNALAPYFKSYVRSTGISDARDGDKMVPSVEKKIAELEMGLLHLQQNIDIPEIVLQINPVVANMIKKCKEEGRTPKVNDFGDKIEDSNFLNSLQAGVNRWIREIQKVTKLDRDPSSGSALQEISFWLNLERALLKIQDKRENVEVSLTLDILKAGKRFMATLSFDADTGLKQALMTVNDYNPLMKDFPLNDLLSATELDKIRTAILNIFVHLKKIRNTKYPIYRCLRLVEAISRDLSSQMLKVLGTQRLMHIPFDEFEKYLNDSSEVFTMWDEEYEKLQSLLREQAKKKREESLKMVWRTHPAHKRLQVRLEHMKKFRKQHEQLRAVIVRVLRPTVKSADAKDDSIQPQKFAMNASDANAIEEVNLAYENVKEVDALDVSKEGTDTWDATLKRYGERISRVEARITAKLRDQLGTAKNAKEMFRIFSRFNALFVRPHIRGAIREYQTQLIQRVKDDIKDLHDKFKTNYHSSQASKMSRQRDLAPVAGSFIWAQEIERQLIAYLRRVEDVLGKGWETHIEGQQLKIEGDSFRLKLNTKELFEEWTKMAQKKHMGVAGKIFAIESHRVRGVNKLQLKVNFQPEIITLFKEVRSLKWMGYRIPLVIVNKAHQANQLYPFAISLIENVNIYKRTCNRVEEKPSITLLVEGLRKDLHKFIAEGCGLVWESYKLDPYVNKFAEAVTNFQEKVDDLLLLNEKIESEVSQLETCEYTREKFGSVLANIQKCVDELNLYAYSNLPVWVSTLDQEVERHLIIRLEAAIVSWTNCLKGVETEDDMNTEPIAQCDIGGRPNIQPLVHEIRITNQVMHLSPPIEHTRCHLLQELYSWFSHVLQQPRIQSQRYQVGIEKVDLSELTYKRILCQLPDNRRVLKDSYKAVEDIVAQVNKYVNQWLSFQALWDMSLDYVQSKVGDNVALWMELLSQIKSQRTTFDTSDSRKSFGPVSIDFMKVQSKVNLKYDSVHKELLAKFGSLLGNEMHDFYGHVSKSRGELEVQSIDSSSTSEAVGFITHVQSLKRKLKTWDKQVEIYRQGQKLLEKQRFQFPNNWVYADNIDGEWSAFNEIMKRKDSSIQTQVASLQMKIVQEDHIIEQKTNELLVEWDKNKPLSGGLKPSDASAQLSIFETKFSKIREERENVVKAKEALELSEPGIKTPTDDSLQIALEELNDLKGVWSELSKIWHQLNELMEQTWLSVSPKKLRQSLDSLNSQLKAMPSRLRQYASFEHIQTTVKNYTKMNVLIVELKADYLNDRHWKSLMKKLKVSFVLSDLTLGHIWGLDLIKNESLIRDVLLVAQGENALEEFLKQVRDCWQTYELELINYQNKTKIIRGWDDLFSKVKEHINSVQAMKLSPYYKVFEEEALAWEDKLNRINALFDVWIDIQRRWVYLEGIFAGSADIKHLLPVETQRFQSISTEFLALMKKVTKSPLVVDVLNIQGCQRQLERLADLLTKIQKALGEYLERERSSFPRFYFVGDEDLLEIIGNTKNVVRLQKHFKKMFAGVNSLLFNENATVVEGIQAREGEQVIYKTPISIEKNPKINEWLTCTEKEMKVSLAKYLADAVTSITSLTKDIKQEDYMTFLDTYHAQLVVLAAQIGWSELCEQALLSINGGSDLSSMKNVGDIVDMQLNVLADSVLLEQPAVRRKKLEHMITELVHQRDVTRLILKKKVNSNQLFDWLMQMRFSFDPKNVDPLLQLSISMSNATFNYGFEYLGLTDKLVQTPLTDRCYLTLTQALYGKYGGSPFGPAGTGKTESVKSLGNQLGRFVLVFNCDEAFDFQAMGRIFVGLCQVGAWGCFDEFNRLEEKMLSAVSQQIQAIQETLKAMSQLDKQQSKKLTVDLVGKTLTVNPDMAIFITMNPGYAGRSNLPDNLKKLFRALAMTQPDRQLIAQVMLFSQGFRTAEILSKKVVPLFKLCHEQLSKQSHYDFGLRALKAVLNSAGNVKRDRIQKIKDEKLKANEECDPNIIAAQLNEQDILIQSICETMVPKLVAEDIPLLFSLLADVFPGIEYKRGEMDALKKEIHKVCKENYLICGELNEPGGMWMEKILQLYQITNLQHGLMLVGPSGSGKSTAWRTLLTALERLEGVEGVATVMDPKAIVKDDLYGVLDPNTREWTDGIFTATLRRIIDNVRGEMNKRQWIIFDGDVDPEWVENLNSVLDDNKLLTLPNGERLSIPPNVRIMFEVQDLKYATLATVSRCGMVWFSEDVLTVDMVFENFFFQLRNVPLEEEELDVKRSGETSESSPALQVQREIAAILSIHFQPNGLVCKVLDKAEEMEHIMDYTKFRVLFTLFPLLNQIARNVINYNNSHMDFPLGRDALEAYTCKQLVYSLIWSAVGDGKLKIRRELGEFIAGITTIPLPTQSANSTLIDFEATINGDWVPWTNQVPVMDIETHKVGAPDVVVPTLDTVRHQALLYTWLAEHQPLCLCGPPGSGKTMTLFSALRALPDLEVIGLNFSSATTPELLMKTLDQYCEYHKTPNGIVISPIQLGKWLVLFCDEINLPDMDNYGTQRVITFLRQLVVYGGFYRTSDMVWVKLERIQIVGACNPPTDPGRKPISPRLLRHMPVVYVDYPGETSLKQIYGTFNRAMLRIIPSLKTYAEPLTNAMVEFFLLTQDRFRADMQPHYIYSPREMTRWVRGITEAIKPLETLTVEGLVRIWAHEALRLFRDRLIEDEERLWTDEHIDSVALTHFPSLDKEEALKRPILFSNWLSKDYIPVDQEELREYVKARLKVFYEEELDVQLVLFNEVLDHVLRIDRVFRQPQGHVLLIGVSGAGKTTLSRFVSWMNGITVYQIKVHNKYTGDDFDDDLRAVLRRSGCKGEKISFIMDEGNILDSSFLERMNTLLANGEVPGLFEGDEYTTLMTQIKEGAQRDGLMLDSNEELYKWFTQQVMRNLHVVFTMNPSEDGLKDRASTSPALFNRCVLNWFGDWSTSAYFQVGKEFTAKIDTDAASYKPPDFPPPLSYEQLPLPLTYHNAIVNSLVYVHQTLHQANRKLSKSGQRSTAITPRHFLDCIRHYVKLYNEKRSDLEEQQLHLNVGLQKIRETVEQVEELQKSLQIKSKELEQKNAMANAKLKQMVQDQQEAEQKKKESEALQLKLEEMSVFISEKKAKVEADLKNVEPAVDEAKSAVRGIKKQNLVEVRSMASPPLLVKIALESICLLLGQENLDWKAIRQIVIKDNFIASILTFNTDDISDEIREQMKKKYLSNPDYNFEKINRASQACGPMVKWAIAQINYAEMLRTVDPLRNELKRLLNQADENKAKASETDRLIADLERSIGQYKEEYALLISQAQSIKADTEAVEAKVRRSRALLSSLSSERVRWEAGSESFRSQMSTIVGDVLLSSAFMAYAGYFDQNMRKSLVSVWSQHLQVSNVAFRPELALVEYLSTAEDRLSWQAHSLPADDLCVENAIMLKRFNRYPLIIDPSGQATEFILNEYKSKKITKTSFLDDAFRKNLESALRFGHPLLVQDVEAYDPILNPVLNREVRRTGGRVLISLGDQDIDLSPTFAIFLSTRDPTIEFPPDLCSRVTFVNFTVTRSSLQSQCLNTVLKAERPDVDEKRSDLLKLQGEFRLRLRHLEKALLTALNESKGKILDDDKVITTLETLKKEAADVQKKVDETDVIMSEVETTSQQYAPLAQACSSIYFTLESLNQVFFLYQYSLQFFLDIFHAALHKNPLLVNVNASDQRLAVITKYLFVLVFERVSRGMLNRDRMTIAVLLARIRQKGTSSESLDIEYKMFLEGNQKVVVDGSVPQIEGLNNEQCERLVSLAKLPSFNQIRSKVTSSEFAHWLKSTHPETEVPKLWEDESKNEIRTSLYRLLAIEAFRPDRLIAASAQFVSSVMGPSFLSALEQPLDLGHAVEEEMRASTPVLMCSVTGYDASGKVEDLANEMSRSLTGISIGSAEGFKQADAAINAAAKSGQWVLLRNVHLAPQWLASIEKKLHSLTPNPKFRLFLTMDITPKIPMNLIRSGRVFVFEPPPGVKANLVRTFAEVPANRMTKIPNERARLYFLLAWFHAIVQERLRYSPLGWSKKYEFNDSDLKCGCDLLDVWIDQVAKGRSNLNPEKVPWDAIKTTLAKCIYGGRIDNEFDQKLLEAFLDKVFTAKSFDNDFPLIANFDQKGACINMPDGIRREQFVTWTQGLPDTQTPCWLGLPNNAETVLLTTLGSEMTTQLLKMRTLDDDDDKLVIDLDSSKKERTTDDGRPSWMKNLATTSAQWLSLVPKNLPLLVRTSENIKDSLFRFFDREVSQGSALLDDVRRDLHEVSLVCTGQKKLTNYLRTLVNELAKGILPKSWNRYNVPRNTTVLQWIADFSDRIKQLRIISSIGNSEGPSALRNQNIWLGGLFTTEAFITATRQYVAQLNGWSLEELSLQIKVSDREDGSDLTLDSSSFGITGLKLLGAECEHNKLELTTQIATNLPLTAFTWVRLPPEQRDVVGKNQVMLPVYLNFTRADLLFTLNFDLTSDNSQVFYERGVALLCSGQIA